MISAQNTPDVALGATLTILQSHLRDKLSAEFETEVTGTAQEFEDSFYYLTITLILAVTFVSTALTLLVIPVVYTLIDGLQKRNQLHPHLSAVIAVYVAAGLAAGLDR